MPVDLDRTLSWRRASGASRRMLEELQANILSPHVREHMSLLFFRFHTADGGCELLSGLAPRVKSAWSHLHEKHAHRTTKGAATGSVYVGIGLTKTGYDALGVTSTPDDAAFVAGMAAGRRQLADPPTREWDDVFAHRIDAVVLLGDATRAPVDVVRAAILATLPAGVELVGEETARAQHDVAGNGIEHFGYADGRSQPLFLDEDIVRESTARWDPSAPLGQVLTADPGFPQADERRTCFGSYLVLRKLEQNVRQFVEAEAVLARQLDRHHPDPALAGAMIMGRFRNGTPLVMHDSADPDPDANVNDFGYDDDPAGARCPYFAHTRKANARGTGGVEDPAAERSHLMARRGQSYGERTDDPGDPSAPASARPTGGVGLMFMAMNASIVQQFVFVQQTWINERNFPEHGEQHPPGLDDVVGQGPRRKQAFPWPWGTPARALNGGPFRQAVTMRGGEYFFLPSIEFLRSLRNPPGA